MTEELTTKKPKTLRPKLLLLALLVIVLAAVIAIGWHTFFGPRDVSIGGPALDPNAQPYSGQEQTGGNAPGNNITIPGYPDIPLAVGGTKIGVDLQNPAENPCYFSFTIVLDETGEVLYESQAVAPGDAIPEETLAHGFDAGTYDVTIRIATTSLQTNEPMNGAEVKTKLVVS